MSKHTPGPWKIWRGPQYEGGGEDICIGRGETWLANMDHRERRCPQIFENGHFADDCDICSIDANGISEEQLANARLMAAAPELLEACKALIAGCPCDPDTTATFQRANEQAWAAIAKAEGAD